MLLSSFAPGVHVNVLIAGFDNVMTLPLCHSRQGFVRMWETLELRSVCELRDPRFTAAVRALAVTPDDSSLITGDDGNHYY